MGPSKNELLKLLNDCRETMNGKSKKSKVKEFSCKLKEMRKTKDAKRKETEADDLKKSFLKSSKNFKCDVCSDVFEEQALLDVHNSCTKDYARSLAIFLGRGNLAEKVNVCEYDCEECDLKRFGSLLKDFAHLEVDVEKDRSEGKEFYNHTCDVCNASFEEKKLLDVHKHYVCEYKCEECGLEIKEMF